MVDRLSAEVMRGYALVPKRGAEVGGLLLGTVRAGVSPAIVVQEFVPVAIEYRRGPSYLLSDQDRLTFAAAVEAAEQNRGSGQVIVGLYRSHTRAGFILAQEDAALFEQYCSPRPSVFLLIRPSATRIPEATFLFGEHGALATLAPGPLFPFRRKYLESSAEPKVAANVVALPARAAEAHGIPAAPAAVMTMEAREVFAAELARENALSIAGPKGDGWQEARAATLASLVASATRQERQRRWTTWLAIGLVCLLVGVVVGAAFSRRVLPYPAAKLAPDELGLAAERQPRGIVIVWNGKAPAVRDVGAAVLRIRDGGRETTVTLSAVDLERGSMLFHQRGSEIDIRLEVPHGGRGTLLERVELQLRDTKRPKGIRTP